MVKPTLSMRLRIDEVRTENPYWKTLVSHSPEAEIAVRREQYNKVGYAGEGDIIQCSITRGYNLPGEDMIKFFKIGFLYSTSVSRVLDRKDDGMEIETSSPIMKFPVSEKDVSKMGFLEIGESLRYHVVKENPLLTGLVEKLFS